jgi:DNA-binding XRE family transcriptional regulator
MDNIEFRRIRGYLGKTQTQLAELLCLSPRAIQSFEQGWRKVSANTERQLLFLLSCKTSVDDKTRPCWEIKKCPFEHRERCAAWEFRAGYFCWFITGTFCGGNQQESWKEKIKLCYRCQVYNSILFGV